MNPSTTAATTPACSGDEISLVRGVEKREKNPGSQRHNSWSSSEESLKLGIEDLTKPRKKRTAKVWFEDSSEYQYYDNKMVSKEECKEFWYKSEDIKVFKNYVISLTKEIAKQARQQQRSKTNLVSSISSLAAVLERIHNVCCHADSVEAVNLSSEDEKSLHCWFRKHENVVDYDNYASSENESYPNPSNACLSHTHCLVGLERTLVPCLIQHKATSRSMLSLYVKSSQTSAPAQSPWSSPTSGRNDRFIHPTMTEAVRSEFLRSSSERVSQSSRIFSQLWARKLAMALVEAGEQ